MLSGSKSTSAKSKHVTATYKSVSDEILDSFNIQRLFSKELFRSINIV